MLEWRTVLGWILELSDPKKPMRIFVDQLYNELDKYNKVFLVGMGKASGEMARALSGHIPVDESCIAVPEYLSERYLGLEYRICPAGHPVPNEGSLKAGSEILRIASKAGEEDLVIALISGGGSALAESLPNHISLSDIMTLNKLLLNSGASIHEINTVRKHVSLIKGGRLAEAVAPGRMESFIISDVPGDRIDMIASGPTSPDPTTFADAWSVIKKYELVDKVPVSIKDYLDKGMRGLVSETPKPGSPVFDRTRNNLILKNVDVLKGVSGKAKSHGVNALILTSRIEGESREVGKVLASISLEILERSLPTSIPSIILVGGETTVDVKGSGLGGRNMELAVSWAIQMRYWGAYNAWILSIDTDGIDGNTDAAGAVLEPKDIDKALESGLNPNEYLYNNDTYTLLKKIDRLVVTGPTGTNVNSITVIYLYPASNS